MGLRDRRKKYSLLLTKSSQIQNIIDEIILDIHSSADEMSNNFTRYKKNLMQHKEDWERLQDLARDLDLELNQLEP